MTKIQRLSKMFATFFYVGECPVAPGSLASIVGVLIAMSLYNQPALFLAVFTVITIVGFMTSGVAEKAIGKKDPGCIVIDEVSGMMISLFMIPLSWPVIIAGYFLFRAFDMFKVYPANKFEAAGGGKGIMLDDIVAGLYTNLVLQAAIFLAARI